MTKSKDGLTAWDAIRLLSPEPDIAQPPMIAQAHMIKSDLELWSGGTTWVDAEYDERLGEALRVPLELRVLLDRLADGTWYAMGLRKPFEPNDPSEYIPAHLWDILDLDPDANTAFGGGFEYFRTRFYEGKYERRLTAAPSPRTTDPLAGKADRPELKQDGQQITTIAAETRCKDWLIKFMSKGGAPDRLKPDYRSEAKKEFGVGTKAFDRAWNNAIIETGNVKWSTPGPRS